MRCWTLQWECIKLLEFTHTLTWKNALQHIDGFSNWLWIQLILNQQINNEPHKFLIGNLCSVIHCVLPGNVLHTGMTLWYCLQKFKQLLFHNCNTSFQLCLRHDPFHLFVFQSLSCPILSQHCCSNLQHFWHSAALHLLTPTKGELQWEEWGLTRVKQHPSFEWALEPVRCFCPAKEEAP